MDSFAANTFGASTFAQASFAAAADGSEHSDSSGSAKVISSIQILMACRSCQFPVDIGVYLPHVVGQCDDANRWEVGAGIYNFSPFTRVSGTACVTDFSNQDPCKRNLCVDGYANHMAVLSGELSFGTAYTWGGGAVASISFVGDIVMHCYNGWDYLIRPAQVFETIIPPSAFEGKTDEEKQAILCQAVRDLIPSLAAAV